jgi:hypothetical protein
MRYCLLTLLTICGIASGCGTTRWSDTARTATEQLLVTDAIDRAVSHFDLRALAGKRVFFDTTYLRGVVDADYLVSSFRQHALASGCILKAKPDDAEYIVEMRAGAVGTDRHDVLFGIPSMQIPTAMTGTTTGIPEIPFVKKTDERAVAKIAVFAYDRQTGRPVWQSGVTPAIGTAKDVWVFGTGPFQHGTIYSGTNFAGDKLNIPLVEPGSQKDQGDLGAVSVASEAYFSPLNEPADAGPHNQPSNNPVLPASAQTPAAGGPGGNSPGVHPPGAASANPTPGAAIPGTAPPGSGYAGATPGAAPSGAGYAGSMPAGPAAAPAAAPAVAPTTSVRSEGSFYMPLQPATDPPAQQALPQTVPTVTVPSPLFQRFETR